MRYSIPLLTAALVLAVLPATGQTVEWTYELDKGAPAPTLFPSETAPTGVVIATENRVVLLNGDGSVAWECPIEHGTSTPITVADLDANGSIELLFTQADGSIHCLDQNGRPLWSHGYDVEAGWFKSVVAADMHVSPGLEVLFGFNDGWLRCVSAQGEELWRFFGDRFRVGGISAGDVDADGAPEVVYGTDNGHVYCLSGTGDVEWRFNELAPYGRSGTNIADLDADGVPEVLFTRSNVNNNTCLVALDGVTGRVLWRTKDVMQGYVSNAVVDFEGDGHYELLHGDKGNNLYAENADGTRRWHAALNARGLFWAPAVADVDGDGQLEVLPGMRGEDPDTGACTWLIGADGKVKADLDLGNSSNAGPAVGDIDGDGQLEVIYVTDGPPKIQCLSWGAAGRIGWASLRGDSRMTAKAPNVAPGVPIAAPSMETTGEVALVYDAVYWGENRWQASWPDPAPEGAFIETAVTKPDGARAISVTDLKTGATAADLHWSVTGSDIVEVRVRLFPASSRETVFAATRRVQPLDAAFCDRSAVQAACRDAIEASQSAGADTSGVAVKLTMLESARASLADLAESGAAESVIGKKAGTLRKQAGDLLAMANALAGFWRNGGTGDFVVWEDANPWDAFDPKAMPRELGGETALRFAGYKNEFEDKALTLFNVTSEPIDVRCVFKDPIMHQEWYRPEDPVTANVTLRRAVPVPGDRAARVFDALPELDRSRSMTIPPGEARQLWVVAKTHDLAPGTHELTLYLGSLAKVPTIREVPIVIEVWPVSLPMDVYAKMNWTRVDPSVASDQGIQDIIDHGMKVSYGPGMPAIAVDAQGNLAGAPDWTAFDAIIARVPQPWTFLWGGPPARQWPEGVKPDPESPEYFNGFRTAIVEMAQHLKSIGIDYHYWAFYPVDEPWNTGFTHIPHLRHFAEMVKRADPKAQMYTDPAGLVRVEYLEEFKDLIDIWQPELNTLKRDPKLVEWFQKNAKRFWYYEAPGPAKDWLPLGHYRSFGWYSWHFGVEGSGYWIYKAGDVWWPVQGGNWSAVYQTNTDVITSRRWEADRDGIEDYRAFYVLAQEIERVRALGRDAEAGAAQALIDQAVEDIIGWNLRNIDEITRVTRDYELDWDLLCEYRVRIFEKIMKLRAITE